MTPRMYAEFTIGQQENVTSIQFLFQIVFQISFKLSFTVSKIKCSLSIDGDQVDLFLVAKKLITFLGQYPVLTSIGQ